MSTDDCAICKHHRATHFPIYPGFCRDTACHCPRFVAPEDLDMRDLRSFAKRQHENQDELDKKEPEEEKQGQ